MPKFRKKPVVIDAIQFTGQNHEEIFDFVGRESIGGMNAAGQFNVLTLEGFKPVGSGYWVIRGVAGEYYPCEPAIFHKTYELVEE